jgi:hypothetical protein
MSSRASFVTALLSSWVLPWIVAIVVLPSATAWGSPVNAEKLLNDPHEGGWSGSVSGSFSFSRGNVDRLDLNGGGSLQYWTLHPEGAGYRRRPAPAGAPPFFKDRWVLVANGGFVRFSLREVLNYGLAHMRYTRMWLPRLGSDAFMQAQYNELMLLRNRAVAGVGMRFDPVNERVIQVWGGTGAMVERERNDTIPGDPHPARLVNYRWTNYAVVQLRLAKQAIVVRNTVYAQPRFDAFHDFRILESVQLEANVTPVFAFGLEFEAQYDSRPPLTVLRTDLHVGSYLRVGSPVRR